MNTMIKRLALTAVIFASSISLDPMNQSLTIPQSFLGYTDNLRFSHFVDDWTEDFSREKAWLEKDAANVNAVDDNGDTLLVVAALNGKNDMILFLLENGAHINGLTREFEDWYGDTNHTRSALHEAALSGYTDTVQLLLDHGARVDIKNNCGETPLHFAVDAYEKKYDIIKMLLASGANINAKNNKGETPLHYAVSMDDVGYTAQILLDCGADPSIKNNEGEMPLDAARKYHRMLTRCCPDPAKLQNVQRIIQLLLHRAFVDQGNA